MQKAISNFIFTNQNCLDSETNNKQKTRLVDWLLSSNVKIQNSLLDPLNSLHIKNHNQTLLIDI